MDRPALKADLQNCERNPSQRLELRLNTEQFCSAPRVSAASKEGPHGMDSLLRHLVAHGWLHQLWCRPLWAWAPCCHLGLARPSSDCRASGSNAVTVQEMLTRYCESTEYLQDAVCEECGANGKRKGLNHMKLPRLLVLQTERFVHDHDKGITHKTDVEVAIPLQFVFSLDLPVDPASATLTRLSHRFTAQCSGVHYVCCRDGRWWLCDDDKRVKPCQDAREACQDCKTQQAYLLFYAVDSLPAASTAA